MNSGNKGEVLTCCFQTIKGNFIVIQSFQITKNFESIGDDISFSKIPCQTETFIRTSISSDRKNLVSLYFDSSNHGFFFIYNIDQDKIIKNEPLISNCHNDLNKFKLYKEKETNEFVFLCATLDHDITIVRMKEEDDFKIINRDAYSSANYFFRNHFNSFNLLYDNELQKYKLLIDPINGTNLYIINTNFNNSFPGGTPPEPLILDPPINSSFQLMEYNKYFIHSNGTNFRKAITINEKDGIIIDLFDTNHFGNYLNQNKTINKSLYALDIDNSKLKGQLKYVLENGKLKDFDKNEKVYGEFKLKYIPPEEDFKLGLSETLSLQLRLKNFSLASYHIEYSIIICAHNCSCDYNSYDCNSCAENYSSFKEWNLCYANSDLKFGVFFDEINKIYQSCYEKCKTCSGLNDYYGMNCLSCYEEREEFMNGTNCYEKVCDYLFYRDKDTHIKTCILETVCPDDYPILNKTTNECQLNITETLTNIKSTIFNNDNDIDIDTDNDIDNDTDNNIDNDTDNNIDNDNDIDNIIFNETIASFILDIISKNKNISSEEFSNINQTYKTLSTLIKNNNISNINEDIEIKGKDAIYQITTTENQKNNINSNNSVIDLGECEKIIKRNISHENDPTPLIILKIDIKKNNLKSTLVEYEVYNPYTKQKIDLKICSNTLISISAPINLSKEETSLYESVSEQGYDIFDGNNSFYQDFCTPYTSENGTDVIIADRKNYYFNENIVLCEEFCFYKGVNTQTNKVSCQCIVKTQVSFDTNHFNLDKFLEGFYEVKDYTNYQVIFCYKLVFSKKGLRKNICFYIFLVFFFLFIFSMIFNLFLALKKINQLIFQIFQDRFMYEYMKKALMKGELKRNGVSIANGVNPNNENNLNLKEKQKGIKNETNKEKPVKKVNWSKKSSSKNIDKTNNIDNSNNSINFGNSNKLPKDSNEDNNKKEEINEEHQKKKHLSHFYGNALKNNDASCSKKFINYFYNFHNNENLKENKNFDNYNSSIQVINNYNIYNLSGKKINLMENDNIKENNINNENSNDLLDNSKIPIEKNNPDKQKKILTNTSFINDKSNYSNPPKKKNNDMDENEYNNKIEKYKKMSRKKKAQSYKITKKAYPKNTSKFIHNESPSSLVSNQSILNSKKQGEGTPKEEIFSKKDYRVSKDVINIYKSMSKNKKKENLRRKSKNQNNNNIKYIDEELNRMEYKDAIINDKRKYLRYYYSLLEKKQLIILTFIANNDYNVFLLKLSLFIISFMLYFAINTLFFRDSTMRRIFIDQGRFKLIYQIPQILYSSLITTIMTFILKKLSLSQNELINIRKEKDKKKGNKIATEAKRQLRIKLYLFFIIGILWILACWYYITAFGAVYPNTQVFLIKDTLISFAVSMAYPFVYNLIPGLFRFPALKAKKKDKKLLYDFSMILSMI